MPDDQSPDDLKRQFEAAIAGMELNDLRALTQTLLARGAPSVTAPEPPRLRRPPLPDAVTFRVRVDLDHAHPPIWRRLDLRSDITLDVVHQVLQSAFGWDNSHLHRFAIGGSPFDRASEQFPCPYDVEEGDEGTPASEVRLDETLQEPGDALQYVYDYGDCWEVTIRLEELRPLPDAPTPIAVCVDGRRAGPPDDCGGITDAVDLARVLDDPAHFDVDEVNDALRDPFFVLREAGVDGRLVELASQLRYDRSGDDLVTRLLALTSHPAVPTYDDMVSALRPITWFLECGLGDGLTLTPAGYLKPKDVEAICEILPAVSDWIGPTNREVNVRPLQWFRASLQDMGLIRKNKGRLLTTKAGAGLLDEPGALWDYLAARLVPTRKGAFAEQSALLIVTYAATSPGEELPLDAVAGVLTELGWRREDQSPVDSFDLYRVEGSPLPLLHNVGAALEPRSYRQPLHPIAAALAHYALLRR